MEKSNTFIVTIKQLFVNYKSFIVSIVLLFLYLSMFGQKISDLSDIERQEEFTKKTEQRVKDLELNIKTIGDKEIDRSIRREAINSTVKYFIDEEKVFQVSSKTREGVREYQIRKYLNRLMVLPYERVEIEWFETQWVTKFRQAPDGKYYGVIRIFQVFKGYGVEGQLKYSDITTKDIEVEIDIIEMDLGERSREILSVKLGDIKVVETK